MHPKKTLSNKDTKFQTKAWIDKNMLHKIKACAAIFTIFKRTMCCLVISTKYFEQKFNLQLF